MGRPAYIYTNTFAIPGLTSSTQDSAYPRANVSDGIRAKPFKMTANGGWLEADFGANQSFDSIAILGHAMPSGSFSGGVTAGASPAPATSLGSFTYREENMWLSVALTSARYVRITVAHVNPPTSWGEVVVEARTVFPRAARWGVVKGKAAQGITHRTYGGVTWDYEHYEARVFRTT